MTDLIPGKRYRYTVDTVAEATRDGGVALRAAGRTICNHVALPQMLADGTATVEQLPDPLPTAPRSLIEDNEEDVWRLFRGVDGSYWKCLTGNSAARYPGSPPPHYGPFTVLFDAGASQ